jgi:hypothetical protein
VGVQRVVTPNCDIEDFELLYCFLNLVVGRKILRPTTKLRKQYSEIKIKKHFEKIYKPFFQQKNNLNLDTEDYCVKWLFVLCF